MARSSILVALFCLPVCLITARCYV